MNWKWLMICTGVTFAASAGLAACGDDEDAPCETDGDCAENEFCIGPAVGALECEQLCESSDECNREGEECIQVEDISRGGVTVCEPAQLQEECTTDTDCTEEGAVCVEGGCIVPDECTADTDCETGEVCEGGTCVPEATTNECETTADCIDQTAYCAEVGAGSSCLDVSCGADLNSCSRCTLGPNNGDRDADGPVIFFPEQVGTCTQDASQCLPGAAPWVCTFSFLGFDDNLPTSDLNNRIRVISSAGRELTVFGTGFSAAGNNTEYRFRACFPETSSGNIGTAVVLRDSANDASNSLCVDGTLQ
ncbi:hypothetical protein [Vulgatibacter sp.]|uniref:hypothetical protein n=1 Tax=Vulgatibacter sp. TaxID=1971226 RepID=UPI003562F646